MIIRVIIRVKIGIVMMTMRMIMIVIKMITVRKKKKTTKIELILQQVIVSPPPKKNLCPGIIMSYSVPRLKGWEDGGNISVTKFS